MNDAMTHCMLISQNVNIDKFAPKGTENLKEAENVGDFTTVLNELVTLIISEFHNGHSVSYLGVEEEM